MTEKPSKAKTAFPVRHHDTAIGPIVDALDGKGRIRNNATKFSKKRYTEYEDRTDEQFFTRSRASLSRIAKKSGIASP
jgi:hypothetical protein